MSVGLTPTIRKVIAEYAEPGWLVMWEDGDLDGFPTADAVLRAVRKADKKHPHGFVVSIIEWRNVPEGWKPR